MAAGPPATWDDDGGIARRLTLEGHADPVAAEVAAALRGEGLAAAPAGAVPDVLLLSAPLLLEAALRRRPTWRCRAARGRGGCGRILFLLPVVAVLPARRFRAVGVGRGRARRAARACHVLRRPRTVNALGVGAIVGDDGASWPATRASCGTFRANAGGELGGGGGGGRLPVRPGQQLHDRAVPGGRRRMDGRLRAELLAAPMGTCRTPAPEPSSARAEGPGSGA